MVGNLDGRVVYYEDRSGAETDDRCGMRYWWSHEEGGAGLVPRQEALAYRVGRQIHEDLSAIAQSDDISKGALEEMTDELTAALTEEDKRNQDNMELLYRRMGWIAAFGLFLEPKIRLDYETVAVEKELILRRGDLVVAVTPDRILRNRKQGFLVYREYKSTVSASQKWMNSWKYAVQIHSSLAAVNEAAKEDVRFAQVMGLMKGDYRNGKLSHPYVWAWHNPATGAWTHLYEEARGANWVSMPVWEYPGGIVEWVAKCGEEVAMQQFPHTEPIFFNGRLLHGWCERRLERQKEMAAVRGTCHKNPTTRELYYGKVTSQCNPPFGDSCPYLLLCWNPVAGDNAAGHPDYIPREPHHQLEVQMRKEKLR